MWRIELPASSHQIRMVLRHLRALPMSAKIDLMVQAGVMTEKQAERAKRKLATLKAMEAKRPPVQR